MRLQQLACDGNDERRELLWGCEASLTQALQHDAERFSAEIVGCCAIARFALQDVQQTFGVLDDERILRIGIAICDGFGESRGRQLSAAFTIRAEPSFHASILAVARIAQSSASPQRHANDRSGILRGTSKNAA